MTNVPVALQTYCEEQDHVSGEVAVLHRPGKILSGRSCGCHLYDDRLSQVVLMTVPSRTQSGDVGVDCSPHEHRRCWDQWQQQAMISQSTENVSSVYSSCCHYLQSPSLDGALTEIPSQFIAPGASCHHQSCPCGAASPRRPAGAAGMHCRRAGWRGTSNTDGRSSRHGCTGSSCPGSCTCPR